MAELTKDTTGGLLTSINTGAADTGSRRASSY